MKKNSFDLCIVGCGPVGASLALCASSFGLRVAVIEKKKSQDILSSTFDKRAIALNEQTVDFLEYLKIWEKIKQDSSPIQKIKVTNGDLSSSLNFSFYSDASSEIHPIGFIVPSYRLRASFIQEILESKDVSFFDEKEIIAINSPEEGLVTADFSDGTQIEASLLVAADGAMSHVRSLCGIEPTTHPYHQSALITTIIHKKNHDGVAYEKFYPSGPFALLPMKDHQSGIVWVDHPEHIDFLQRCETSLFLELLKDRCPDLGELTLATEISSYPLSLKFLTTVYQKRVVFIGDAAHAIHPLAGQSLNLGFRDAMVLGDLLKKGERLGLDIGSPTFLQEYQKQRRFDTFELISITHGLNRLFSTSHPFLNMVRSVGLKAFSKFPFASWSATRHAMGRHVNSLQFLKHD